VFRLLKQAGDDVVGSVFSAEAAERVADQSSTAPFSTSICMDKALSALRIA
jgi:hypothetical protein